MEMNCVELNAATKICSDCIVAGFAPTELHKSVVEWEEIHKRQQNAIATNVQTAKGPEVKDYRSIESKAEEVYPTYQSVGKCSLFRLHNYKCYQLINAVTGLQRTMRHNMSKLCDKYDCQKCWDLWARTSTIEVKAVKIIADRQYHRARTLLRNYESKRNTRRQK